ncbi:hypothetical protein MUTS16_65150 [Escherichia coli]|nr:hypothetical protein MUTS16_65150 [Escherichia coli]
MVVEGVGNLMHHIARCCQPIPGDEIVGFITQGRGISVHRADCEQLAELRSHAPERIVDAVWGETTPPDIRWWSAWWLMIVVGCYVISPPFSPTRR